MQALMPRTVFNSRSVYGKIHKAGVGALEHHSQVAKYLQLRVGMWHGTVLLNMYKC